jgi:hypothetical protein
LDERIKPFCRRRTIVHLIGHSSRKKTSFWIELIIRSRILQLNVDLAIFIRRMIERQEFQ